MILWLEKSYVKSHYAAQHREADFNLVRGPTRVAPASLQTQPVRLSGRTGVT